MHLRRSQTKFLWLPSPLFWTCHDSMETPSVVSLPLLSLTSSLRWYSGALIMIFDAIQHDIEAGPCCSEMCCLFLERKASFLGWIWDELSMSTVCCAWFFCLRNCEVGLLTVWLCHPFRGCYCRLLCSAACLTCSRASGFGVGWSALGHCFLQLPPWGRLAHLFCW